MCGDIMERGPASGRGSPGFFPLLWKPSNYLSTVHRNLSIAEIDAQVDQLKRDLFALRIKFAKQEVSEVVLGNGQQFTILCSPVCLLYCTCATKAATPLPQDWKPSSVKEIKHKVRWQTGCTHHLTWHSCADERGLACKLAAYQLPLI